MKNYLAGLLVLVVMLTASNMRMAIQEARHLEALQLANRTVRLLDERMVDLRMRLRHAEVERVRLLGLTSPQTRRMDDDE